MSTPTKPPRMTRPQEYALGKSVQQAYDRRGWDGNIRAKERPTVTARTATVEALERLGMVRAVEPRGYRASWVLTPQGVEIGTQEAIDRLGEHPKDHRDREQAEKNAELNRRNKEIEAIANRFASFKVRARNGKKKVTVASILTHRLAQYNSAEASLSERQWRELGEQIANLIP